MRHYALILTLGVVVVFGYLALPMRTTVAMLGVPILSCLIFLPLVGAAAVLLIPSATGARDRAGVAFAVSLATFLVSLPLWSRMFDAGRRGMQFVERVPWIPSVGRRATTSASTASACCWSC